MKAVMSAKYGDLLSAAEKKSDQPEKVHLLEVFAEVAKRDMSRGYGELQEDDHEIIRRLESNPTLEEVLEDAGEKPAFEKIADLAVAITMSGDEPSIFIGWSTAPKH